MKQLLTSYVTYELWANERLMDLTLTLDPEWHTRQITSSFPSVYKTFLHMWDASSNWWQRLQGHEQILTPSLTFHPGMRDIGNGLIQQSRQWVAWMEQATDETVSGTLSYKNSRGEMFEQPISEIILHLCNHGTFHRGQLVTLFRQLGVEKIPATDYIIFSRTK